jgi:phosphate-selective porin OprO/OprP
MWVNGYEPGTTFGDNNGTGGATFYNGNPSFEGGYVELGYFFTGETRGYKGGKWDRTKVLHPVGQGGLGAIQLNGRLDYIDLNDRVDGAPSTATPLQAVSAPYYVNGGKQLAYELSLIWTPMDYIRFMAQYGHISVTGGPRATTVEPNSNDPANKIKYGVNIAALRAQLEF